MFGNALIREIGFWIVVKVAAMTALFFMFFSPDQRPVITPEGVGQALVSSTDAHGENRP